MMHLTSRPPELVSWETVRREGLSHRDLIFALFSHISSTTLGLVKKLCSKIFSSKVKGPKSCFPGYFQEENTYFFPVSSCCDISILIWK